jgi:hypothetical protein
MTAQGLTITKVDVTVDELKSYCRKERLPLDSAARAQFVSEEIQGRHTRGNRE